MKSNSIIAHRINRYPSFVTKIIRFLRCYCVQWILVLSLFFAGGYMSYYNTQFFTNILNKITKNDRLNIEEATPPKTNQAEEDIVIDTQSTEKKATFFDSIKKNFKEKVFGGLHFLQNKIIEFVPWTIIISSLVFSVNFLESYGLLYALTMMMILFSLLGSWFWASLIGIVMLCIIHIRRWLPNIDTHIMNFFNFIFHPHYRWWICSIFCCFILVISPRSLDVESILWAFVLCFSMWRCLMNLRNDRLSSLSKKNSIPNTMMQ